MTIDRDGFAGLAETRRSVRRFTPEPVPESDVVDLLNSARWAPSPHNSQPWRYVVVRPGPLRLDLADIMASRWLADLTQHNEADERLLKRVATRRRRLMEAPAAVVACLTEHGLDAYPDEARRTAEWLTAEQSLGAAVQNVLLAAHARGLGACWICAPTFCSDLVRDTLDLPSEWQPRVLVLIGHPAEPLPVSTRKDLHEFITFR